MFVIQPGENHNCVIRVNAVTTPWELINAICRNCGTALVWHDDGKTFIWGVTYTHGEIVYHPTFEEWEQAAWEMATQKDFQ